MNLDYKVFGRDSIFMIDNEAGLSGFSLKRARRKLKKVVRKVVKLPVTVVKKTVKVIKKNRKLLKKIGGIAALAYGGYFLGPKMLGYAKSLGGSSLAKSAGTSAVKRMVRANVRQHFSPQQEAEIQAYAQTMTPQQFMTDPNMLAYYQQFAQAQAGQNPAYQYLASEGAIEVGHQIAKAPPGYNPYNVASSKTPVKKPSVFSNDAVKVLIPVGIAVLTMMNR